MISKGKKSLDLESFKESLSEPELVFFYIKGLTQIPSILSSPFRKDEHPSFSVFYNNNKILWKDFATGESGDIYKFVQKINNCSYKEALQIIYEDFKNNITPTIKYNSNTGFKNKLTYNIRSKRREWQEYDFEYWNSYGIPKEWIMHADVYPIEYIYIISSSGYIQTIKADKYAYTYIERKDNKVSEKIYQPFNKLGFKWRSAHDYSVWDLWSYLPDKGKKLIITSSRKDALCLWANLNIPSISPQSETVGMKPQVMEQLKKRFNKIYVLFDNDKNSNENHGRLDGIKFCEKYNLTQIEIPSELNSKDPSDLFHNKGKEIFINTINSLL